MARDLREHILQTASALFYSQGIKATGVDAIVKAAGTTKMSLYKYFPSKDDLVLAHLEKNRAAILARLEAGISERASEPRQKLLAVFDIFDDFLADPEFRGCPFINASAEFAEAANPVQLVAAEFSDAFRGLLADLARQADAKQPDILAAQLAMLISGAMVAEQMRRQSDAMRTARAAAEILLKHSMQSSTTGVSA